MPLNPVPNKYTAITLTTMLSTFTPIEMAMG